MLVSQEKLTKVVNAFGPEYTSLVFVRYQKPPANMVKATESHAPSFRNVTDYFSREATLMWLRFHIAETFAFLGIYDTASKGQIVQTAELVLDHEIFGQLSLDEFLLFLTYFKRGDYGKIYQSARPNPQEFLMCLRPFWNDLVQYRIKAEDKERREREERAEAEHRKRAMSYDEWQEIKMLTRMYEMQLGTPTPPLTQNNKT